MENAQLMEVAEVQLTFRTKVKPKDRPHISCSRDAYDILKNTWDEDNIELYETFRVMFLNRAHRVLGILNLSIGGVSGTIADPKLIFVAALKCVASGIIVAHNHPSGNLNPSQTDIDLTRKLKEAGKFLEIQLLDHLICTVEGYYSFADGGMS